MFEKASLIGRVTRDEFGADIAAKSLMIGQARGNAGCHPPKGGDALRALDWTELTTRLNAARELRLLLRRDSQNPIGASAASFGDAAARYFHDQLLESERPVNLDALEGRKASQGNVPGIEGNAATAGVRNAND